MNVNGSMSMDQSFTGGFLQRRQRRKMTWRVHNFMNLDIQVLKCFEMVCSYENIVSQQRDRIMLCYVTNMILNLRQHPLGNAEGSVQIPSKLKCFHVFIYSFLQFIYWLNIIHQLSAKSIIIQCGLNFGRHFPDK